MTCFIINFNRLHSTVKMCNFLSNIGLEICIVDNNSTYPPLLEYYEKTDYGVIRLDRNYGHTAFWTNNLYDECLMPGEEYILSDPDLDLTDLPKDFVSVLQKGLDKYPMFKKCGVSLRIDDLPKNHYTDNVIKWEKQFWEHPLDDMYFNAGIDTTLALYRENKREISSLRTNFPYSVRHNIWYYTDPKNISDDELYYINSLGTATHWAETYKREYIK